MRKREWLSIPNLMGYLRIILALLYFILILRFVRRYPLMEKVLLLFVIKESFMLIGGLLLMRRGWKTSGATWYGKVCTATMYLIAFLLLGIPRMSLLMVNLLLVIEMVIMVITLFSYVELYLQIAFCFHTGRAAEEIDYKLLADRRRKRHRIFKRSFVTIFLGFAIYIVVGAFAPFTNTKEVSESTKQAFDINKYYSDTIGNDRAAIIEDNGQSLDLRLQMISHAQKRILLSTFDFRADEAGKDILAALLAAADRGVIVELFVDGFNFLVNMEESPYFMALSAHPNAKIIVYNKLNLFKPWTMMARMHDKYLMVDETAYLLGGRNTFSYFLGNYEGHKNYDRDILVYNTGSDNSSVYELLEYYEGITSLDCCVTYDDSISLTWHPSVMHAKQELEKRYEQLKATRRSLFDRGYDYEENTVSTNTVHLLKNPTHTGLKEPVVFNQIITLASQAKMDVTIHTPYVICDEAMYEGLKGLGNKARVLFNSAANNGNLFAAVDYMQHKEEVLDTGIRVLEYEGGVSYHGKSLVIDDDLSLVGSFNMDMRSAYINTELMVVVDSKELNKILRQNMEAYEKEAATVQGIDTYISYPDNRPMKEIATKKKVVKFFLGWLLEKTRFLM